MALIVSWILAFNGVLHLLPHGLTHDVDDRLSGLGIGLAFFLSIIPLGLVLSATPPDPPKRGAWDEPPGY